jgi:hypothetical protein
MHPTLAPGGRLALHLAVWTMAGALLAAVVTGQAPLSVIDAVAIAVPLALAYGFFCLSAWYVARGMPLGATPLVRVAVTSGTAAATSAAIWLGLARVWLGVLSRGGTRFDAAAVFGATDRVLFGFGLLLYLFSLAVAYVGISAEESREAERRGFTGQVLAREAELRSLRAQIDPHFLFNSLHSISALTGADPAAARRMCLLLADFLRDSLALGAEERITLARELSLAARFLDIERVRFGERLRVEISSGGADACLVPPLILQPLVENAVTHGVAHVLEGGTIAIHASATPAALTLVVENPCDRDRPCSAGAGVGLANVRARLRALHGDDARLSASERGGVWRVELVMPAARSTQS